MVYDQTAHLPHAKGESTELFCYTEHDKYLIFMSVTAPPAKLWAADFAHLLSFFLRHHIVALPDLSIYR